LNNLKQIQEKQNEDKMLRCQFAARECFNQAELLTYASWLLSILSALTLFLPDNESYVLIFVPLGIDILAYLFHYLAEKKVSIAAKLRNYFDCIVLNIDLNKYSKNEIHRIWEIVNKICHKHQSKCKIQINHTGRDTPPGVKNWYEFPNKQSSDINPIFECQRQNCWWNDKLCSRRLIASFGVMCILIFIAITTMISFNIGAVRIIVCFLNLFFNLVDSIRANIHYVHLSMKMNAIIETPDTEKHTSQIEHLQELICSRREFPVLEINILHKLNALKWSETYEAMVNDSEDIN